LYASIEKAESLGDKVEVIFDNGSITLDVVADAKIIGDIVKVPDFRAAEGVYDLFGESRYKTVTLRKV
jgi:NADH-quinone oxidoreductase subunit G